MNQHTSEFESDETDITTETTMEKSPKLKDVVQGEAARTGETIKEGAKAAVNHFQDAGKRFAVSQKEALSQKTDELAQALGAALRKFEEGDESRLLAGPAKSAADQLGRLSNYLKESDPGEILQGLGRVAHRKPELFFGGLFLAGLLTARFLKASGKTPSKAHTALPANYVPSYYSVNP